MGKSKLDSFLWEQIPFDNFIFPEHFDIKQENMDELPIENVDELRVSRDDDYNIKISCVRHIKSFNDIKPKRKARGQDYLSGTSIPEGKIEIKLSENYFVDFAPCYYNGYKSNFNKTEYQLSCDHIEGRCTSKKAGVIKEWVLNGSQSGLYFCRNRTFEYKFGATSGLYGDMEFPIKESLAEQEYDGRFIHIKYKDTAFDVHFVSDIYGPKWSTNLSISYFEKYGRIPSIEERNLIRDYLSFFIGKRLIYIGESSFDENGSEIGFVMKSPHTYGFDIKQICLNGAKAPIKNESDSLQNYFDVIQKYIEPFETVYNKLDLESLFSAYWYAKEIAKPMDLPILAGALEYLMKKWYEEVELNPETVLMDKKDFSKRIKPIKELVASQFEGTEYVERMKRSIERMNGMSVNEQFEHFFEGIGMPLGDAEKRALKARNISAHGAFRGNGSYQEHYMMSQVYTCIITRVVLKLLSYTGKYVDYGTIGHPEKDINCPCGNTDTSDDKNP